MDELKCFVKELEKERDLKRQKEILQRIGAKIINTYVIKVGTVMIEPFLVEAYYYHKGKFEDTSVHASKPSKAPTYELARQRQQNHFGELYVHYGLKDGIDIVLSLHNGSYLSFLIKNALVNGEWATQCKISEKICEKCNNQNKCKKGIECSYYGEIVISPRKEPQNLNIVFVPRKGIPNDCTKTPLAALPINKIRDYQFTAGKSRTAIVQCYIKKELMKNPQEKELLKLKKLAYGLVSWNELEKN